MNWRICLLSFSLATGFAFGQATVSEIKIHLDSEQGSVRPLENMAIQVRVYGQAGQNTGRIRKDGAEVKVLDQNGGWLSKPFRFQGTDNESFIDQYQTTAGRIFGSLSGQYVLQDAFMYTAPEKPGNYRIEAKLGGFTAAATIRVDYGAASTREAEQKSFSPEMVSLDPYRDLAEHYAPMLAQETWFQPKSDYPARFDFDGDWNGGNNWDNMETGTSQAYVHYAAMETETHWFLHYNVFHPRDYSDKCVAGSCHENDNEGLILTIQKDGSPYGRLQVMETLAHNNIYSFVNDRNIREGVHSPDGDIAFHDQSHPIVFIEAGGHGIYGTSSSHSRYNVAGDDFGGGTGVTFVYKGAAERPRHANDRLVGYDLLPIYQHWWTKADAGSGWPEGTFDAFYNYEPYGGRPRAAADMIGGSFFGRAYGANKAKPFWGWHDNRTRKRKVLNTGQWALDPAYAISQNLRLPGTVSTVYTFNPYLQASGTASTPASPRVSQGRVPASDPVAASPKRPGPATSGTVEFSVWVDDVVEVVIHQDRVYYQVLSGAPYRDNRERLSATLPTTELSAVDVQVRKGRGKVKLTERPTRENGYVIRLRIEDNKRSGAEYQVRVQWRQ